MATRFYFNTGQAADLSLTRPLPSGGVFDSNVGSLPTTRRVSTTSRGTANNAADPYGTAKTIGNGTNPNDVLYFQGLSGPLAAQTISGNVTGVVCIREGNTSDNLFTQLAIFVVDAAGAYKATLFGGGNTGGTEANNPSANSRNLPRNGSTALSSYTCADGDRLVVEVGLRTESTRTTAVGYMYIGDPGGDLPTGDGSSNNLTISPWIELSGTLTFGYTPTGSITANAVIKKTGVAASFTADAVIASGTQEKTGSFTADAVKFKAGIAGTFTADAIKRIGRSGSFTADAWKGVLATSSFTADAVKADIPAQIIDDPFDDPATVAGTWGAKWTAIKGIENSTAEIGRNPTVGAFIYDDSNTVLDSERGGYINRRTYLRANVSARVKIAGASNPVVGSTKIGLLLRHSGETSGIGYYNATYAAVDLVLDSSGSIGIQIRSNYNTIVYGLIDLTATLGTWAAGDEFYIRGWIKGSRVKGKVWRVGNPEPRWQINQAGLSVPSTAGYKGLSANTKNSWKPVEWDIRLVTAYNLDYSIDADAVILSVIPGSLTANAVKKATRSASFTADAFISTGVGLGSLTADAIKKATATGSLTADAVRLATAASSITANAVKLVGQAGTLPANAVIVRTVSGSLQTDALIRAVAGGSLLADSVILATLARSLAADAIKTRTVSGSLTVDALMRIVRSATITGDAWFLRVQTGQLIAAAVLQDHKSATITADAVLRDTRTAGFVASALVLSPRTQTLPADAVVLRPILGSLSADATFYASVDGDFTADAVIVLKMTEVLGSTLTVEELTQQLGGDHLDQELGTARLTFAVKQTYQRSITADAVIV